MSKLLSILLPTTIDRKAVFDLLLKEIFRQIIEADATGEVEVLIDEDAKEKSIGKKRQDLLEKASGHWVVGIDSDDWISEHYLIDILSVLKLNPEIDHVGFIEDCDLNGKKATSIFSIKHRNWDEKEEGYNHVRCANPKSVIKRTKALQAGFKDLRFSEDRDFSERVTPLLLSEVFINKSLYFYRYKHTNFRERYGITSK